MQLDGDYLDVIINIHLRSSLLWM